MIDAEAWQQRELEEECYGGNKSIMWMQVEEAQIMCNRIWGCSTRTCELTWYRPSTFARHVSWPFPYMVARYLDPNTCIKSSSSSDTREGLEGKIARSCIYVVYIYIHASWMLGIYISSWGLVNLYNACS